MPTNLELLQTISLAGTTRAVVWTGSNVHISEGNTLRTYNILSSGLLELDGATNMGVVIEALAWDGTYLHVYYNGTTLRAVSYNTTTKVHSFSGNAITSYRTVAANIQGEIFAPTTSSTRVSRFSFDGTNYTEEDFVASSSSNNTVQMRCSNDYLVVGRANANVVDLIRISDMTVVDTLSLNDSRCIVIWENIVGIGTNTLFRVYDITAETLDQKASYTFGAIVEAVTYDRAGNFHTFLTDDVYNLYFDGSSLTLGESLLYVKGSAFYGADGLEYLYATHSGSNELLVFSGEFAGDISATPLQAYANDRIDYSTTYIDSIDSIVWHFGDSETSTSIAPEHRYEAGGLYTVSAVVTYVSGRVVTITKQDYITIIGADFDSVGIDSAFAGTPIRGYAPLKVDYSNNSRLSF